MKTIRFYIGIAVINVALLLAVPIVAIGVVGALITGLFTMGDILDSLTSLVEKKEKSAQSTQRRAG